MNVRLFQSILSNKHPCRDTYHIWHSSGKMLPDLVVFSTRLQRDELPVKLLGFCYILRSIHRQGDVLIQWHQILHRYKTGNSFFTLRTRRIYRVIFSAVGTGNLNIWNFCRMCDKPLSHFIHIVFTHGFPRFIHSLCLNS